MKRVFFALLVVCGFLFTQDVHAQRTRYYYYPDANVYYNPVTHEYAYSDNGTWTRNRELPNTVVIHDRKRHVTVYHDKGDVWMDNDMHRKKYKDWGHKDHDHDRH